MASTAVFSGPSDCDKQVMSVGEGIILQLRDWRGNRDFFP